MKRNLFLAALMITYMSVAQLLVSPEGSYVGGTENGGSSWSNQPKYKMKGYLQNGGNSVQFNFRKNQDYLQGSETTLFTEPGTVYLRKGSVNGPILAQEVVHTNTYYKKISLYQNQLSGFPFDVYAVYYPTNTTGHGWVGPISIDQVNQLNAPNLSISQNNNHNIVLNWSSVNGAQDYILERSLSPNSGFTPIYTGSGSSFVNNFYVANGEHYYYRVQACDNNSICGEYSNVVDIINHPAPPVISVEINSDGHIELDWNNISGSSNYNLERSTSPNSGFTVIYTGSTSGYEGVFYTDYGVQYYYRVKTCFNNTECGEYSNVVDIINHPAPPVISAEINSDGHIELDWNTILQSSNYILERSTSVDTGFTAVYSGSNSDFVSNFNTHEGVRYYFRVKTCFNNTECGEYSNVVDIINHPAPPVISAEINSDGHIELDWNNISGSSNYNLERSTSPNSGFTVIYTGSTSGYEGVFYTDFGVQYYLSSKNMFQ